MRSSSKSRQTRQQRHIATLYQQKATISANTQTLAQCLNKDIYTVFECFRKLALEFIQNADDAQATILYFTLEEDHLIISHNGRHFTPQDVEKLCDYAPQDPTDKRTNIENIGHKGIGFKSVFLITDRLIVCSDKYRFRFDKQYLDQAFSDTIRSNRQTVFPWQITPIWTDEVEMPTLNTQLDSSLLHFIVQLKPNMQVHSGLEELLNDPKLLLFLNHINCICINNDIIERSQTENAVVELHLNQSVASSWLIQSYTINIPEEISRYLQTLNSYTCPEKLKSADEATITFAAQIENGNLIAYPDSYLACSLPTQEECGLPFLFDTRFLLNAERTRLLQDNAWNEYLITQCVHAQFRWLVSLSQDPLWRKSMLAVLGPALLTTSNKKIKHIYEKTFSMLLNSIPFLPTYDNQTTLLKNAVIDLLGFFHHFNDCTTYREPNVLDQLLYTDKLIALGSRTFDKFELIRSLPKYAQQIPTENWLAHQTFLLLIRKILTKKTQQSASTQYKRFYRRNRQSLSNVPFVLDGNGNIKAPDTLFINTDFHSTRITFTEIYFPHPSLFQDKGESLLPWLIKHGACEGNKKTILDYIIKQKIQATLETTIDLARFIYEAHCEGILIHYQSLSYLNLLTKSGELEKASHCCLSNEYHPNMHLESLFDYQNIRIDCIPKKPVPFVSPDYCAPDDDISAWRNLFKNIGVIDKITFISKPYSQDTYEHSFRIDFYSDYISKLNGYGRGCRTVLNFLGIYYLSHLKYCPAYSTFFWKSFKQNWLAIKENAEENHSHYESNRFNEYYKGISYLEYVLKNHVNFLATDGKYHLSHEINWPGIQNCLGPNELYPNLPVELTQEQAAFIGLRTTIGLSNILKLMSTLTQESENTMHRFVNLIKQILTCYSTERSDKEIIAQWARTEGMLIATNNTYQPIHQLTFLPLPQGQFPPRGVQWLKPLSNTNMQVMQRLCELFGVQILDEEQLKIGDILEEFTSTFKENLEPYLALFGLLHCDTENLDINLAWPKISYRLNQLQILQVETIHLVDPGTNTTRTTTTYRDKQWIYFSGELNNRRRKQILKLAANAMGLSIKSQQRLVEIMMCFDTPRFHEELEELLEELGLTQTSYNEITSHLSKLNPHKPDQSTHIAHPTNLLSPATITTQAEQRSQSTESPSLSSRGSVSYREYTNQPNQTQSSFTQPSYNPFQNTFASRPTITAGPCFFPPSQPHNPQDPQETNRIGLEGEKIVFINLKSLFVKIPNADIIEDNDYSLSVKINNDTLTLFWDNNAPGLLDLQLYSNGTLVYCIEVKATKSHTDQTFFLTPSEWEVICQESTPVIIARAYGVDSDSPRVEFFEDPLNQIRPVKHSLYKLANPSGTEFRNFLPNIFSQKDKTSCNL